MDHLIKKLEHIPFSGIVFAVMSAVFLATASVAVPVLSINPIEIVVIRSVIGCLFYGTAVLISDPKSGIGILGERKPLILRGVCGFFSFGLAYVSMKMIPLADASAIVFSSPISCLILAYLCLDEEVKLFHIFLLTLTMTGVFLISRPAFLFGNGMNILSSDTRIAGVFVALGASISMAYGYICVRQMPKTPDLVIIFVFNLISIICGLTVLVAAYFFLGSNGGFLTQNIRLPNTRTEIGLLLLNGLCGIAGQMCVTIALRIESAALVALSCSCEVVIAFVYQAFLLPDQDIVMTSVIGAVCICLSIFFSMMNRWLHDNPDVWTAAGKKFKSDFEVLNNLQQKVTDPRVRVMHQRD